MTDTTITTEPDYAIDIIERDGLFIVCEGGVEISKPMEQEEAKWWANHHQLFVSRAVVSAAVLSREQMTRGRPIRCRARRVPTGCTRAACRSSSTGPTRSASARGPHRIAPDGSAERSVGKEVEDIMINPMNRSVPPCWRCWRRRPMPNRARRRVREKIRQRRHDAAHAEG